MEDKERPSKKIPIVSEEHAKFLAQKDELENLKKQLEAVQRELAESKDRTLRVHADFDNAKKRLAKERAEILRFAGENLMRGLLPILDNFKRALSHTDAVPSNSNHGESLRQGVELIHKQLEDFLAKHGLVRLQVLGTKFDPHFHEAVGHVTSGVHPEDTVAEEVEAGYLLEGKLLRPAKVRITQSTGMKVPAPPDVKAPEASGPDEGGGPAER